MVSSRACLSDRSSLAPIGRLFHLNGGAADGPAASDADKACASKSETSRPSGLPSRCCSRLRSFRIGASMSMVARLMRDDNFISM